MHKKCILTSCQFQGIFLLMKALAVGELKAQFSEVLDEVKKGRKVGILYGRAKKPVAMIVPYNEGKTSRRKIGILDGKATIKIIGDGKITEDEFLGL